MRHVVFLGLRQLLVKQHKLCVDKVGMAATARIEEDLSQNRFLQVLRASFEGMYRQAAKGGEKTVVLVPCADCLEAEHFGQNFAETHLLQATCVPGCYTNLLGQGVEIKDSSVSTRLGFSEQRVCEVLQSESMYDVGNTFRVLVTWLLLRNLSEVAIVRKPYYLLYTHHDLVT